MPFDRAPKIVKDSSAMLMAEVLDQELILHACDTVNVLVHGPAC